LNTIIKDGVESFAYPKGSFDNRVKSIVSDRGFKQAVTVEECLVPLEPDWFQLPRVWIHPDLSMRTFKAKTSFAINHYRKLKEYVARKVI